ncbi:hypothetical protein ACIBG7_11725 [Nonomuraea sp. NPDC050328]|uniref:aspartate-alanine antiporter-like transporter n=1 Tax=Nonomuraea sp. NPDC050328 TaxID=3364361 RepID=UPI0037A2987E
MDALRQHAEIAIFLTMALGFFIGRLGVKGIVLGSVTGTLLAGVLIGQLDIKIPDLVKTVAFIGFLFALGFKVGPQFFAGLKKSGIPQVIVSVVGCVAGLLVAWGMAVLMGYGPGWGSGLLAGGLTQSAVIGVATDAINASATIPANLKQTYVNQIPVGYAVCYLFGTAAAAYFLSQLAWRLLGSKSLVEDSKKLERELGTSEDPDLAVAYRRLERRTYRISAGSELDGSAVGAFEERAASLGHRIFLYRYRRGDTMAYTDADTVLRAGDVVTVTASHADLIHGAMNADGVEVDDPELLDYDIETLPVVLTKKVVADLTPEKLATHPGARGLFITKIVRSGIEMPVGRHSPLHVGDTVTIQGARELVERAVPKIGQALRSSDETDFSFVGLGIFLGGLIGIPTIAVAGADIGLTTSGGALIMGLIFGWLHAKHPAHGRFPAAAEWLMNTGGLCMFVGIVGITAGPNFIAGLKQEGFGLLLAGLVVTLVPMVVTLALGKLIYRWPAPINLGVTAGTFTTTASIGAVTDAAKSQVPVLGYTVPYAIGNTLLTIWGTIIVALLS